MLLLQGLDATIKELCTEILSEPAPDKLPQKIIDHVQKTFPIEWSSLWVTEQDPKGRKLLRIKAVSDNKSSLLQPAEDGSLPWYEFGEGLTGAIAERRKTINITKYADFAQYGHAKKFDHLIYPGGSAEEKCRCTLGVPLMLRSSAEGEWRVIGVLKLENVETSASRPVDYFTDEDVSIVEAYAAVIAVALEKAQMRADSLRVGSGLLKISESLLKNLGQPPNLQQIVERTAEVISAKACALWLREGIRLILAADSGYTGVRKAQPYELQLPKDRENAASDEAKYKQVGLTVYVAHKQKPVNLKTAQEVRGHFAWLGKNDQMWLASEGEHPCHSLVAIPLVDQETLETKGVFKIENKSPTIFQLDSYFTGEDQQLLETLGNSISLSLIISERFTRLQKLEKLVENIRVPDGLDVALFFILTGLTHGSGLGYNRAMIFLADEPGTPRKLTCRFAVGHLSMVDWSKDVGPQAPPPKLDLYKLLDDFGRDKKRFTETAIMREWYGREVDLADIAHQKIAYHAAQEKGAQKYLSQDLNERDVLFSFAHGDFVLTPIYAGTELRGIIYSDNRFTGNTVNKFERQVLDLFSGMAAAIIQASFEIPERLRKENESAWRLFSQPAAHRLGTENTIIEGNILLECQPALAELASVAGNGHTAVVQMQKSFDVIRRSVNRLRDAAKDYRQLTPEPEDPQKFDVAGFLDETVGRSALKGLDVTWSVVGDETTVRARRRRLGYVFEELLLNAWKESPGASAGALGGDPIRVSIQADCGPDLIRFVVADSGPGIPDRLQAKLFKEPQTGRHGGTGLGMLIMARILREEGGGIEPFPAGRPANYPGACFRVTIPRTVNPVSAGGAGA